MRWKGDLRGRSARLSLARIADPGGKGNLVAAGRVAMTRVRDGTATIVIDATGLSAEQRAMLERQVRAQMVAVPGIADTRIAMTAERAYRGLRHRRSLPVRGQRTHTNARTRKGKAKPIAGKKK